MSPTPPNKELSKNFASDGSERDAEPSNLENTAANLAAETEQIEREETEQASNIYAPLPQQDNGADNNGVAGAHDEDDDDDDDDEDDEDDSDFEINEDLDFEMLANSRAFQKPKTSQDTNLSLPQTVYTFEPDYFERKKTLECEEIKLDEEKSEKIKSIMSGFKLPESAIPEWAKLVPENIWKKNLLETVNAKKTDLFTQDENNDKA
jgi:hypothetical protein